MHKPGKPIHSSNFSIKDGTENWGNKLGNSNLLKEVSESGKYDITDAIPTKLSLLKSDRPPPPPKKKWESLILLQALWFF